jgi:hypothetical protein
MRTETASTIGFNRQTEWKTTGYQNYHYRINPVEKGIWAVQEEDGENRITWKRMSYIGKDLQP